MRKAKAAAAHEGRPLRDLVADALTEKLYNLRGHAVRDEPGPVDESPAWKAYAAKLQRQPDGSYINPDGIEDESFFTTLDEIRKGGLGFKPRDPFGGS